MKKYFYLVNLLFCLILSACLTQPTAIAPNNDNLDTTDWLTYSDEDAEYSFQYPPKGRFVVTKDGYLNFDDTRLVFVINNQAIAIETLVLENVDGLPLNDFIRTTNAILLPQPNDIWPVAEAEPYLTSITTQNNLNAIEVEQSKATWPLTGICRYVTYIAHQDLVILIRICPGGRNPLDDDWYPDQEAMAIYQEILNSVTLTAHSPVTYYQKGATQ